MYAGQTSVVLNMDTVEPPLLIAVQGVSRGSANALKQHDNHGFQTDGAMVYYIKQLSYDDHFIYHNCNSNTSSSSNDLFNRLCFSSLAVLVVIKAPVKGLQQ